MSCVALALGASADAQPRMPPGRKVTLTVRWTSTSAGKSFHGNASAKESLSGAWVLSLAEVGLQQGPAGVSFGVSGGRVFPLGKLESVTGKTSYRGDDKLEGECGIAAAVNPHTTHEDGEALLQDAALSVTLGSDGRPTSLELHHGVRLTQVRHDLCDPGASGTSTVEHPVKVGFPFAPAGRERGAADEGWKTELRETAKGWEGTARRHAVEKDGMGGERTGDEELSFALDMGGPLRSKGPGPSVAGDPPAGGLGSGTVTFTQGGKEVRWPLARATVRSMGGVEMTMLTYASRSGGSFETILTSGGLLPPVAALNVEQGPSGDSRYEPKSAGCVLALLRSGVTGTEGTITCSSGFVGPVVSRAVFTAAP